MTSLVWDKVDERRYEAGINHGVFYPSVGPGVAWNGILSVAAEASSGDATEHFLDAVKYLSTVKSETFQATLRALTEPAELAEYVGSKNLIPGVSLTQQPKRRFNLAYQTGIEDGTEYKIHLVYNVLAIPGGRDYSTIDASVKPLNLSWKLDAIPVTLPGFKPTSHLVIDSSEIDPEILVNVTDVLYGTTTTDPRFPTVTELLTLFEV